MKLSFIIGTIIILSLVPNVAKAEDSNPMINCDGTDIEMCVTCSSTAGLCKKCMRGAGLDEIGPNGGAKCIKCPIGNCMDCELGSDGSGRKCQRCMDGYKLKIKSDSITCESGSKIFGGIIALIAFFLSFRS